MSEHMLRLTASWECMLLSCMQGLDGLTELRDLNLAGNRISAIGRSLEVFSQLEALNLSGNRLSSLKVPLARPGTHLAQRVISRSSLPPGSIWATSVCFLVCTPSRCVTPSTQPAQCVVCATIPRTLSSTSPPSPGWTGRRSPALSSANWCRLVM